jgi:hypothetical protein
MPDLAARVVASPFDAAVHDAFGKVHGRSCYQTYGPEFLRYDLGHYLAREFAGRYLHEFVDMEPKPWMPVYHLVGALDPITDADVSHRVNDGLPETLPEWIHADGLTHLKIEWRRSPLGCGTSLDDRPRDRRSPASARRGEVVLFPGL